MMWIIYLGRQSLYWIRALVKTKYSETHSTTTTIAKNTTATKPTPPPQPPTRRVLRNTNGVLHSKLLTSHEVTRDIVGSGWPFWMMTPNQHQLYRQHCACKNIFPDHIKSRPSIMELINVSTHCLYKRINTKLRHHFDKTQRWLIPTI